MVAARQSQQHRRRGLQLARRVEYMHARGAFVDQQIGQTLVVLRALYPQRHLLCFGAQPGTRLRCIGMGRDSQAQRQRHGSTLCPEKGQ
ncbi:hypothetical protein D3C86_1958670 [compost metagenome]